MLEDRDRQRSNAKRKVDLMVKIKLVLKRISGELALSPTVSVTRPNRR